MNNTIDPALCSVTVTRGDLATGQLIVSVSEADQVPHDIRIVDLTEATKLVAEVIQGHDPRLSAEGWALKAVVRGSLLPLLIDESEVRACAWHPAE